MKIKYLFSFILIFFSTILTCKMEGTSQETFNANLHQIIDFEDELKLNNNNETPLQFSTIPLKTYFNTEQEKNNHQQNSSQNTQTSKINIFNQAFSQYIKKDFNKPELTDLLSRDGSDIIHFLKAANDLNLDTGTVYVGLRLFHNKIKSCDLILNKVTDTILTELPDILKQYFDEEDIYKVELDLIKKSLEQIILNQLTENFIIYSQEPSEFAKQISSEITEFINQELQHLYKKEELKKIQFRLRMLVIRFIENLLGKTLWDDKNPEEVWPSFISIANNLQRLGLNGILDHMDELDELLWTLTYRFCFFLSSFGLTLPLSVYDDIEHDLKYKNISFLEAPEQDEGIKTKKEHFYKALFEAKVKAHAYEKGIIAYS